MFFVVAKSSQLDRLKIKQQFTKGFPTTWSKEKLNKLAGLNLVRVFRDAKEFEPVRRVKLF